MISAPYTSVTRRPSQLFSPSHKSPSRVTNPGTGNYLVPFVTGAPGLSG